MPSRDFCTSLRNSPNVRAVFEAPLPSLLRMYSVFVFVFVGNVGAKTQTSKKNSKTQMSGKKLNKGKRKGTAGTHWTCVQNFRVYLSKRRGHPTLKEIGFLCSNQPVTWTQYHTNPWIWWPPSFSTMHSVVSVFAARFSYPISLTTCGWRGTLRSAALKSQQDVDHAPDGLVGPRTRSVWGQVLVRHNRALFSVMLVCMILRGLAWV